MADRYVILPPRGIHGRVETPTLPLPLREKRVEKEDDLQMLRTFDLPTEGSTGMTSRQRPVKVVDEVPGGGAKLVELPEKAVDHLHLPTPGSRVVKEQIYRPAVPLPEPETLPPQGGPATDFEVLDKGTSRPLEGATVTAFVNPEGRAGVSGVTDSQGKVSLALGGRSISSLGVKPPPAGWWGAWERSPRNQNPWQILLAPLDLSFSIPDVLRHFYGPGKVRGGDGEGVRVGVIDTGIANHPDLSVQGGANTVPGEKEGMYGDNGLGHGTQVAGIIAAGNSPKGICGLAPEVELLSFRVYPEGSSRARSFPIMTAITRALDAGCHLLNLSFETPHLDEILEEAVQAAHHKGAVVIAASGNDGRPGVAVPARYAIAVTALGRLTTFPAGALEERYIAHPKGADPKNFLAGFSNTGPEVSLTAPGLGVVSTVPGGYAPVDGTSMAAAAATGMAARLLSQDQALLSMPPDTERSKRVRQLIATSARSMGLGFNAEGYGML